MNQYRYELKFKASPSTYMELVNSISFSRGCFYEQYPHRKVESIYFEQPDFHCLNDMLSDSLTKFKVRLRWYDNDLSRSFLEIKIKKASVGKKTIIPIGAINLKDWNETYQLLIEKCANHPEVLSFLSNPVLNVSYNRNYFVGNSVDYHDIRITFDKDVEYSRCLIMGNELLFEDYQPDSNMIIELKFPPEKMQLSAKVSQDLSPYLNLTKNSKFFNALTDLKIAR